MPLDTIRWIVAAAADKSPFPTMPQRKQGRDPHDDLLDKFPNLVQLSRGPRSRMPTACTQHAVRINDLQKAEEAKRRKNVNKAGRIRADHTTGEKGRDSSHSLVSPGEPRLDSLSVDHLSQRSAQAGTWVSSQGAADMRTRFTELC